MQTQRAVISRWGAEVGGLHAHRSRSRADSLQALLCHGNTTEARLKKQGYEARKSFAVMKHANRLPLRTKCTW